MNKVDCFYLGTITSKYGFKGELLIFLDVDEPAEYERMESMYVEFGQKLIPFLLQVVNFTKATY